MIFLFNPIEDPSYLPPRVSFLHFFPSSFITSQRLIFRSILSRIHHIFLRMYPPPTSFLFHFVSTLYSPVQHCRGPEGCAAARVPGADPKAQGAAWRRWRGRRRIVCFQQRREIVFAHYFAEHSQVSLHRLMFVVLYPYSPPFLLW